MGAVRILAIGAFALILVVVSVTAMRRLAGLGQPRAETAGADTASTTAPPASGPTGPAVNRSVPFDASGGTVTCFRAATGPEAGWFVIQVVNTAPVADDVIVGVELAAGDQAGQDQAVPFPVLDAAGTTTVTVPGTGPGTGVTDCVVAALQIGEHLTLTGS